MNKFLPVIQTVPVRIGSKIILAVFIGSIVNRWIHTGRNLPSIPQAVSIGVFIKWIGFVNNFVTIHQTVPVRILIKGICLHFYFHIVINSADWYAGNQICHVSYSTVDWRSVASKGVITTTPECPPNINELLAFTKDELKNIKKRNQVLF